MADHGKQLRSSLIVSGLILLSGVFVLLVWFFGDPLGIVVQILLTVLVLFAWALGLLVIYVRRRRARRAAVPAGEGPVAVGSAPPRKSPGLMPPTGNYPDLSRGVEEAVQWLQGTKLGGSKKDAEMVYALPWFLVAGPHGSGKTSLALSSGFDFHALPSQRASEQNLIRPTAGCEFRVTDDAIIIDTSGRYQTEGAERDEWAALIETIKGRRKARPFDGYVLTVNAAAVMRGDDEELEQQAKVLRARLDEALLRTRTRFPVYLVFTHVDDIEGFGEFFGGFSAEERAQVWGATIPLSQSQDAHALFDAEFDHLSARLVRRRMFQLGGAASPTSQLQIFKFPGRFRRARSRLGLFASALFRPNPFRESPILRGFYFTSSGASGAVGARRLTGGEYFVRGFFHDVVLPDKDVVAAEQASRRRPRLWRDVLLAAACALVAALVVGMIVSYSNNNDLIARANAARSKLERARRITSRTPDDANAFNDELDATEGVRQLLAELDENEKGSPPLGYRFGLYSGDQLNATGSPLKQAYFEAVNYRFLAPTVAKLQTKLSRFVATSQEAQAAGASNGSNAAATDAANPAPSAGATGEDYLGTHYDLLKAYMMLSRPDKVEPAFLANTLRDYWKLSAPPGREEDAVKQLDYLAAQLDRSDAPHPQPDNALVADAQQKLTAYPPLSRVYKLFTAGINKEIKNSSVSLSTIQDAREGNILSGSYTVPPAFTLEGYRAMKKKLDSSVEELSKDDWVMRGADTAGGESGVKKDQLEDNYYGDYIRHWQNFLQDIKIKDIQNKEDAVRILRALSDENSPLDRVLRVVARQTKLSAAPGGGVVEWIKNLFSRRTGGGGGASVKVEKRFEPLIKLMSGDASATAEYRSRLKKVADKLKTSPKSFEEISKGIQAGSDQIELTSSRQFLNDMLDTRGFGSSTASDAAAQLLKRPLDNLNSKLVGADFELMERTWQQLAAKSQALEAGFPFADAASDSSVAALAQFLNPQDGELTKFFNERLAIFFDESWSPKKDSADKFAPDFITYLASAKKLSDALFPDKGKQPKVEYQISVAPIKGAIIRVDIDGNSISAPDKPSASFNWPNDKSGAKVTTVTGAGEDVVVPSPGEWGLLKLFRQSGGGDGKGAQFTLQVKPSVAITIQPKSGTIFQRDLFAAFKSPKRLQRQ